MEEGRDRPSEGRMPPQWRRAEIGPRMEEGRDRPSMEEGRDRPSEAPRVLASSQGTSLPRAAMEEGRDRPSEGRNGGGNGGGPRSALGGALELLWV